MKTREECIDEIVDRWVRFRRYVHIVYGAHESRAECLFCGKRDRGDCDICSRKAR